MLNHTNSHQRKPRLSPLILAAILCITLLAGCTTGVETDSTDMSATLAPTEVIEETPAPTDTEPEEEESESDSDYIEEIAEEGQEAEAETTTTTTSSVAASNNFDFSTIPACSDNPYTIVNDNEPFFIDDDLTTTSYEYYSDLDELGRCGVTMACIGQDIMPTEDRGDISSVYPSGWVQASYDDVDGGYLYNRCHLIGYQLAGENDNEKNLITGTRYLNVEGMLPFENMVADYVEETDNHVLYRVTPIFEGDNLVASGVLMEAKSVEDDGDGVLFCVYCYNIQPGITIDYTTGESWEDGENGTETIEYEDEATTVTTVDEDDTKEETTSGTTYILNTNTKKFHYPSCSSVDQMSEANKQEYTGSREDVIAMGYDPCGRCNP